ncbi:RNA polymerase Rpc34 [Dissoconium aciculare CBS 342.82]|uniref:DNA-directed RNA polymerase III subunit RPC6 n=1 Tax=Dissoconium aciculare CBS 342.82 TaxID=1314786 RepID=A0A6J3LV77_9PEZI|nr:RNA polymerase Rpc34 [Dissoconium aciculare CBS 342.82]KAF1818532.1 RNA polymerase Rpc34 [Dissoconium aciculare CBS 342.82]
MADVDQLVNDSDQLYKTVAENSLDEHGGRTRQFNQDQLLELSGLPDSKSLMPLIQYLSNNQLFRTTRTQGKLQWSIRPREAAKQIKALDRDDKVVYGVIEEAHDKGIWSRDIKKRAGGIADNIVKRCLEKMEKANLIKGIKSVKSPAQRTYMLAHLVPSEEVTGNSFYDAGDLDESFRDELMKLIVFWVRSQSWVETKRRSRPPRREIEPQTIQLTHRVGTHNYPTAQDIYSFVTNSHVIKPSKASSLTVQEIQDCINVLQWDTKLERVYNRSMAEWGYRTVRGVTYDPGFDESPGTALTQVPCGTCPVFEICAEGGPVNPQECVYLDEWLKL